jgi:hypothetical protein
MATIGFGGFYPTAYEKINSYLDNIIWMDITADRKASIRNDIIYSKKYLDRTKEQIMIDLGLDGPRLEKKEKLYIIWLVLFGVSYDLPYV